MYRTTPKSLDKRLSKEEQLVYLKCFVPKSLADLRRLTLLDEATLESTLSRLIGSGFLYELTNTIAVNPKATLTAEMMTENALDKAKQKVQRELERSLGVQATPFVREVQAVGSIAELKGVVKKILLKLKLTVSQKAAKEVEMNVGSILNTP
jgi:hypothetical protein